MLREIHEHIMGDLQQGARTDTVFVVTAIVFNLVMLGVNSAVAGEAEGGRSSQALFIFAILIVMSVLINGLSVVALQFGKQTRNKLLSGLLAMYRDNEVDKYYEPSLLVNYDRRYALFTGVILCLAATAILVPLVILLL